MNWPKYSDEYFQRHFGFDDPQQSKPIEQPLWLEIGGYVCGLALFLAVILLGAGR